ncbi:unnamed protein product, partial [Prorocentrum cordatum]
MVAPTWHHWLLLQRLASYLGHCPQPELFFKFQGMPKVIVAEVDSDWASEPGWRSVGGGFLFIGSHLIDGWSGQQGNRALSSAGAVFKGIVNGLARGIWLRNVMLDMGFEMTLQVNPGSSGAKGIAPRWGSGRVRHLATKYLWAQEKVRDETITMAKIRADTNRADMQTKPPEGPRFLELLAMLTLRTPSSGRTQVFGVMLAATVLGGIQGMEVAPASQAPIVMSSPTAMELAWATPIAVMFGSALAVTFLSAWIGYRVYTAPMRFLNAVEAPPGEEHLAIVESGISRRTQTTPIKHYWTWSATEMREECLRLCIYRGQLKSQMIEDLLK